MTSPSLPSGKPKLYSAPRRFDLSTMLVVTAAYALLFAGMKALNKVVNFDSSAFVMVAGLFTVVGVAQSLFADRYSPRWVSVLAGTSYYIVLAIWEGIETGHTPYLFNLTFNAIFSGGIMGYFCGVLVGGVFLVSEFLRTKLLGREPAKTESGATEVPDSPWDE